MMKQKNWIVISSAGLLAAAILLHGHLHPKVSAQGAAETTSNLSPEIRPNAVFKGTSASNRVAAALAAIRNETDPTKRETEIEEFLAWVSPADIPQILKNLEDPKDETVAELRQALTFGLTRKWANYDPTAAAVWAQQLPDGDDRDEIFAAVANEVVRTKPLLALKLAADLPEGQAQQDLVAQAAAQWAATDPKSAMAWSQKIDDEPFRQRVIAGVITQWADADPTAAAAAALSSLPEGRIQDDAIISVVERMAQKDPQQAATWVTQFPSDDDFRQTAMENVVKLWADKDAPQLETWLQTLSSGPLRDSAVATYVRKTAPSSPSEAEQWASSIANGTLRNQEMETVAETWMNRDSSSARAWIKQGPLPVEIKARLLTTR
jgi:hypothetical protein